MLPVQIAVNEGMLGGDLQVRPQLREDCQVMATVVAQLMEPGTRRRAEVVPHRTDEIYISWCMVRFGEIRNGLDKSDPLKS